MSWVRFGRAAAVTALALAASAGLVMVGQQGSSAQVSGGHSGAGDYPGTQFDYGLAAQFATSMQCGGPFGHGSTYCDTPLSPAP
jgi:hypothetical protein